MSEIILTTISIKEIKQLIEGAIKKAIMHCTLQDEFIIPCPKFGTN
jgi:hypothetical protein